MKAFRWISNNILFVLTLFFLAFVPLYPKIPVFGVTHTFVYIRIEDFLVSVAILIYLYLVFRKKVSLRTPLTLPIIAFWIIGLIATVSGVVFIFPHLPGVFPKIAALFYLRHIEYISLFFIAFAGMRDKKYVPYVIWTLVGTLLLVVLYAIGQRFIPGYFPAYSTMNEEFAKGIPLTLSALGRIQSTFAGHYDLAAYLVMFIPIVGSLVFGYKNWWIKLGLLIVGLLSVLVLLMTASRTSFAMYLVAVIFMLILQKQKKWIIPVIIISFILLKSFSGLYSRYAAIVAPVNVIIDARTGKSVGIAKTNGNGFEVDKTQSNGESLPPSQSQFVGIENGNGKNVGSLVVNSNEKGSAVKTNLEGDFVIKKAQALDISFTTRLQAEWPNAIKAFQRNILFGSGYSSISLATDGNYFRILGETGLLGFLSFGLIFLIFAIYTKKVLPDIESKSVRALLIGINAGILGLALNAVLIDVFEASKVAFVLWTVIGVGTGILKLYQKEKINFFREVRDVLVSLPSISLYLVISAFFLFSSMLHNFFVGDDYTWLRWAADCRMNYAGNCDSAKTIFINYLLHAQDFFYRPGAKMYYYFLYKVGTMDPLIYHFFSLLFHIFVTLILFFVANKLFKSRFLATIAAAVFLVMSSHSESIFWIASAGHLITSYCIIAGLWFFMLWREKKNILYLLVSFVHVFAAPLFQELGIVAPLLIIYYTFLYDNNFSIKQTLTKWYVWVLAVQIPVYLLLRTISGSIWGTGDYAYNIVKLPINVIGNAMGYVGLSLIGPLFSPFYTMARTNGKANVGVVLIMGLIFVGGLVFYIRYQLQNKNIQQKKLIFFSLGLFIIPLLPFLGLGNIADRYVYLSSAGALFFILSLIQPYMHTVHAPGKNISLGLFLLLIVLYCGYNIGELNKLNNDWRQAGVITTNTISTVSNEFLSAQALPEHSAFYFVNVPIRYHNAWVFPVGLSDAMWLLFQNDQLVVKQFSTMSEAMQNTTIPSSTRIFIFTDKNELKPVSLENILPTSYAK
jgi:hypothetical protein